MIAEDQESQRLDAMKVEQSKQDMAISFGERASQQRREVEISEFENERIRLYAEEQARRESNIRAQKAAAETEREKIFAELKVKEEQRLAEAEYVENLRNELQQEEFEEMQREKERAEEIKREEDRHELLRAKAYQEQVKVERQQEELRIEDDFKHRMLEKFAEDDRIEQMNMQRRRMKELEHKREVERLWQEKL